MPDHILVTGGAGFVGSHLCAALQAQGHAPVAVDDMSNGQTRNVPDGVPLVIADLGDPSSFDRLASYRFSAVYHLAAQSSNAISFRDPRRDLRANQLSTLNLLEFCDRLNIRRLIFTSSMSAYGQPGHLPTPEDEPCQPRSFYGVHKLASEQYVRLWSDIHPLDWTILRLYTTYGPGQNLANRDQGLIKIYLGYVLRNEPLLVRGSGSRVRDCVHVTDVVDAMVRVLWNSRSYGRAYNIGSGQPMTVREILDLILSTAGHDPAAYPVTFGPGDPGDPDRTHADITALHTDLGWSPKVTPADGVRETVRTYLAAEER